MSRSRDQYESQQQAGTEGDPYYCSILTMLYVVLLGFLLALVLTLAGLRDAGDFWWSLGLNSLFVIWAGLLTLFFLCLLARNLKGLTSLQLGIISILLVLVLVFGLSLAVIGLTDVMDVSGLLAHSDSGLFLARNVGIGMIVSLVVSRYLVLHDRWKRQVRAESTARLDSLQSRIRPHFLFNALNTISSLIHDKPDQAEQATMDLSDLLRTGLKEGTHHALSDELELVRGYLRIESLRLGDRLDVEWHLADDLPLDYELPVLLIQPLVENAVIHGIARLPEGGKLHITGDLPRRKRLRFVIENPVPEADEKPVEGNRIALDNIRQRLELAWEEGARLKTRKEEGRFRVELIVPVTE